MAFIVPWMFVNFGLRKTLLMASAMNATGSLAKYLFTMVPGTTAVLSLTYVAQGRIHSMC